MPNEQRARIKKTSPTDLNISIAEMAHSLEWMMDPSIRTNTDDRATPEKYVVAATGIINRLKPILDEFWNEALDASLASTDMWVEPQSIRLHAGEITAQEMRTVRAIIKSLRGGIERLKIEPPVHR